MKLRTPLTVGPHQLNPLYQTADLHSPKNHTNNRNSDLLKKNLSIKIHPHIYPGLIFYEGRDIDIGIF